MIVVLFQRPFLCHCHLRPAPPPPPQKNNMLPALPLSMRDPLWLVPLEIRMAKRQKPNMGFGRWSSTSSNTNNNWVPGYLYKLIETYIIPSYNVLSYKGGFQPYANKYSRTIQGEFKFLKNFQEHHFTTFRGNWASHHWPILLGSTQYLNQTFLWHDHHNPYNPRCWI